MNREHNARESFESVLNTFETELGTTLEYSDERRIFLHQIYLLLLDIYATMTRGEDERLLRYMTGEFLNEFGEGRGVIRLQPATAHTVLRFHVQEPQPNPVIINMGTKATTYDKSVTFATDTTAVIQPGEMYTEVAATSLTGGAGNSGIEAGQISVIVDPIPYVSQAENIDVTHGGSDLESDDSYRERIRLEMSKISTAGAEETYQYWALSAHPSITYVDASSPSAGEVLLTVLLENGELPDQSILDDVHKACNAKERRPLAAAMILGHQPPIQDQAKATETLYSELGVQPAPTARQPWAAGEYVGKGAERTHGDKVYTCVQPHQTQAGWEPDKTPALWAVINTDNAGTLDDPIPAALGMEYFEGKYYSEGSTIYLCTRDSGQPLHYMPSALVGHYFSVVG